MDYKNATRNKLHFIITPTTPKLSLLSFLASAEPKPPHHHHHLFIFFQFTSIPRCTKVNHEVWSFRIIKDLLYSLLTTTFLHSNSPSLELVALVIIEHDLMCLLFQFG
ncbi:hypothetical protein HanPI659440_Chr10g0380351 [Helianthus annuus]|nr:hypothetical protein HanPI659440_Chr10g0380351 [Helianthus annuus]